MAPEGSETAGFEEFEVEELIRFKCYDSLLRAYWDCLCIKESYIPELYEKIARTRLPVLKPSQINSLFEGTKNFSRHENFQSNTGLFFSMLIQDSYDKGNNLFLLNSNYVKKRVDYIGYRLKGKEDSPLRLRVKGNAGYSLVDESSNLIVKAEECGDWLGKFSKGIKAFVKRPGAYALWHASDSLLIADFTGIDTGKSARNCEFRTKEKETLERLLGSVPAGNRIVFIDENNISKVARGG